MGGAHGRRAWRRRRPAPPHPSPRHPTLHTIPPGYFLTKIFHPNVSSSGEICVNVLKRDWRPDLGLRHVLTVIRCLLIEPNAESGGWVGGWRAAAPAWQSVNEAGGQAGWRAGVALQEPERRAAGLAAGGIPLSCACRRRLPVFLAHPTPAALPAALNEEAGKLLLEGFDEFARKARLMTSIHARKPSVLTAAGGANAVNADGTAAGAAADGKPSGGASGSGGAAAGAAGAAKPSKAAAAKLAEKKKSLKRL